jgi:adenine-specific DNA-methyltransferase
MGSKRSMLKNGLGELLLEQVNYYDRFVDLFTGTGFVSWFVAERVNKPVLAVDLQRYSTVLAECVISRTKPLDAGVIFTRWATEAKKKRNTSYLWKKAEHLSCKDLEIKQLVDQARMLCKTKSIEGPIWSAYGGYYFSPIQALTFDYLIGNLPEKIDEKIVCLASCISAASECVASPGHTAQPFRPTTSAGKYILDSWRKDPLERCRINLEFICQKFAKITGSVITDDAQNVLSQLNSRDLVFIDPPYSGVQYSRFYHVLETIARCNTQISVFGAGRYPVLEERPQSKFSNISQAKAALKLLLQCIAEKGSTIIFTFPSGDSSNGLSGDYIKTIASEWFFVEDKNTIEGQFSTLGGNNGNRKARNKSSELILLLQPKT